MTETLKYCATCKKEVAVENYSVHVVHCQRNMVTCSLCEEPVLKSQYQLHVENAHKNIKCEKCGEQVESLMVFLHQKELCPKRMVKCTYCDTEVVASDIQAHMEFCGSRTSRCKGCSKYVQSKHLQFHYQSDHKFLSPEDKEKAEAGGEDDDGPECPICLGAITLPLTLDCGHVFCMICVKGIANTTKNCAICRQDIQRDMLMDIRFCREEDIIKNYVNKPRGKKNGRSNSVPIRPSHLLPSRFGSTTQDYDSMVSALLSSRTSSTSYRYQRPNNTHTPPVYTPYSYSSFPSSSVTTTSTVTGKKEENYCKPLSQPAVSDAETSTVTTSKTTSLSTSSATLSVVTSTTAVCANPRTSSVLAGEANVKKESTSKTYVRSEVTSSLIDLSGAKPKRPTTLALSSTTYTSLSSPGALQIESEEERRERRTKPPTGASQEEYDRWLAFQLAQAEDDVSISEFNKKNKTPYRRSQSMPERTDEPTSADEMEPLTRSGIGRPPASPRTNATNNLASSGYASYSPSPRSSCSPGHSSSISKSSSDPNAALSGNSAGSHVITGARPKSCTGLKKRVSFKEDAPPVKREAPVLLPCEFCEEMFPERDLMRHQTGCEFNETQQPRLPRISQRPPTSVALSSKNGSTSSTQSVGIISTLKTQCTTPPPPRLASKVSPTSPTPRLSSLSSSSPLPRTNDHKNNSISPTRPPLVSQTSLAASLNSESSDSPFSSRHTSVSPGPISLCSSSGVSSSLSNSSVSTTPSTSTSGSPIPSATVPGTPTDVDADFEDDDGPFSRPRRGRLLSSAIFSWKSISSPKPPKDKPKYTRSNTAPIEGTGADEEQIIRASTSNSVCPTSLDLNIEDCLASENATNLDIAKATEKVFIKNPNKYKAPPPPFTEGSQLPENSEPCLKPHNQQETKQTVDEKEAQSVVKSPFKFDSMPMMSNERAEELIPCEYCHESFTPTRFRNHQALCESLHFTASIEVQPLPTSNLSTKNGTRHSKGPAPLPPQSTEEVETSIALQKEEEGDAEEEEEEKNKESKQEIESYNGEENHQTNSPVDLIRQGVVNNSRRLERASSVREETRPASASILTRRWSSRDTLVDDAPTYLGTSTICSSLSSLLSSSTCHSWASHISMIREDARARAAVNSSMLYDTDEYPENEYLIRSDSANSFLQAAFFKNSASQNDTYDYGSVRYRERSTGRPRPVSMFTSTTPRLSSYDLGSSRSPHFTISDPIPPSSVTSRKRYLR